MKIIWILLFLVEILIGRNPNFRLDSRSELNAQKVVFYSAFWLSRTAAFSPYESKRLLISLGYLRLLKPLNDEKWVLPDANLAIKITNNLALSGKIFRFSSTTDQPQVIGAGLQYFFGNKKKRSWVFSIQRVDLNGLYSFQMKSFTFDIRKWFSWKTLLIRVGAGANYFKQNTYKNIELIPSKIEGRTNYFGSDAMLDIVGLRAGIGFKVNPDRSFISFFLQKNI